MYQAIHHALEKHEDLHGSLEGGNLPIDACLVLTTDPKPRLRWTAELHERFVDAVTQLGGPDKATPKTIMRAMGVKGLTLYHLKSHLQKYRLGKQACKELTDGSQNATSLLQNQGYPSSMVTSKEMNDGYQVTEALRVQMEVQRRLHEQLEVQRHLELRIEAQGKYLQSILEKAFRVLADQNMASTGLDAARQELSELTIKVSTNSSIRDTANLASITDIPSIYPDERSVNRQTQMTDCSVDSCLTSNDSSGLLSGEKKRTRPMYCDSGSLVWESDVGQDVQWTASI